MRRWLPPEARFVADSPLEGDGFEPSVPGTKEPFFVAEGELRGPNGGSQKGCFLCGTEGSNPCTSRGESIANPIFGGALGVRRPETQTRSPHYRPTGSPHREQTSCLRNLRTLIPAPELVARRVRSGRI